MSFRFLLALAGFILIVGSGSAWLFYNIIKKKNLLRDLLNLPKERRLFWYKLREAGFTIISHNTIKEIELIIDGMDKSYSLKADFIVKKKNRKYVSLFAPHFEEKEYLKQLFAYSIAFNADGVIYYNESEKNFTVWEMK